jgi:hypothetical protein
VPTMTMLPSLSTITSLDADPPLPDLVVNTHRVVPSGLICRCRAQS